MDSTKSKAVKPAPVSIKTEDLEKHSYLLNHYPETFSGEVFAIVYKPHNGFSNFAIATIAIEKGMVKKIDVSQNYAGFETIARLDIKMHAKLEEMQLKYPAGFRRHV